MPRSRTTLLWGLFAMAAIAAIVGGALLLVRAFDSSTTTTGATLPHDAPPAAIDARVLCSLSNDDALAALVTGADGGTSVVVGNKTWWLFGDTIFRGDSGKQIEANSIAVSTERRPDGCPRLEYHAENGISVPFIEKDGSLTVWPTGGFAGGNDMLNVYTAYVYGNGPYSYSVDEVGAVRLDTDTMQTEVLNRRLWDENSGFPSRVILAQPIEMDEGDELLHVVLHAQDTSKYLARVEPDRFADSTAYEFWDGAGWSESAADVSALWSLPTVVDPVEQLLNFENGASVTWNPALNKYVALVNAGFDGIGARVADRIEGPWSEPVRWLDCLAFANARVPTCYSPQQHASYASEDGRRIYATISAIEPYETQFVEITLGDAIHEWRDGDRIMYAPAVSSDQWEDQGVAFYASAVEHPGFVPVFEWTRGGESQFAPASPADGWSSSGAVFYVTTTAQSQDGLIHYRPVYDWANGDSHILSPLETGLEEYGYKRGLAMFYAP